MEEITWLSTGLLLSTSHLIPPSVTNALSLSYPGRTVTLPPSDATPVSAMSVITTPSTSRLLMGQHHYWVSCSSRVSEPAAGSTYTSGRGLREDGCFSGSGGGSEESPH